MRTTRQDLLLAAAALGGGLLVLFAHGYTVWSRAWDPSPAWRTIPLLGVCAAMLLRRTAPMAALAVATPLSLVDLVLGPSLSTVLAYSDVLYSAALYGPGKAAGRLLGATVGVTAALGLGVGLWQRGWGDAVVVIALAGMSWAGPVLTAMVVAGHRDRAELERQRAAQLARLAELDRGAALAAERARMARELHDVVANHLSAVALHSSALLRFPDLDADRLRESMTVIRENSVRGLAEMRRMIGLLRAGDSDDAHPGPWAEPRPGPDSGSAAASAAPEPRPVDAGRTAEPVSPGASGRRAPADPRTEVYGSGTDDAVVPSLRDVERLVSRNCRPDLRAVLRTTGDPAGLPAPVDLAAYRIVQESLTNALKHAGPGTVEVRVERARGLLTLTVTSPLGRPGADPPGLELPGAGAGLVGMRERVSVLGGSLVAGPRATDWIVRAELPLRVRAGGAAGAPATEGGAAG